MICQQSKFVTAAALAAYTTLVCFSGSTAWAQEQACILQNSKLKVAENCLMKSTPSNRSPILDAGRVYDLETLIDMAERFNPEVGSSWARAKVALEQKRIQDARSLPTVTLSGLGIDSREISPFPKPLAPRGYVTVEVPLANAQMNVDYALLDFARGPAQRSASDQVSAALSSLDRKQQTIAYNVEIAFFGAGF